MFAKFLFSIFSGPVRMCRFHLFNVSIKIISVYFVHFCGVDMRTENILSWRVQFLSENQRSRFWPGNKQNKMKIMDTLSSWASFINTNLITVDCKLSSKIKSSLHVYNIYESNRNVEWRNQLKMLLIPIFADNVIFDMMLSAAISDNSPKFHKTFTINLCYVTAFPYEALDVWF